MSWPSAQKRDGEKGEQVCIGQTQVFCSSDRRQEVSFSGAHYKSTLERFEAGYLLMDVCSFEFQRLSGCLTMASDAASGSSPLFATLDFAMGAYVEQFKCKLSFPQSLSPWSAGTACAPVQSQDGRALQNFTCLLPGCRDACDGVIVAF